MKKISFLLFSIFLCSCTSNTIFEKPKDLIPKDTMSLLIQELMIASSSKYMKNKNQEKKVNYMPFVYERFNIDSVRFQTSNMYYVTKIDVYQAILEDAKTSLEKQKAVYSILRKTNDSIRKDSIDRKRKELKESFKDSLKKDSIIIDKNLKKLEDPEIEVNG